MKKILIVMIMGFAFQLGAQSQVETLENANMIGEDDIVLKVNRPHTFSALTVIDRKSLDEKYLLITYDADGSKYMEKIYQERGKTMLAVSYLEMKADAIPTALKDLIKQDDQVYSVKNVYDPQSIYAVIPKGKGFESIVHYDKIGRKINSPE